MSNKPKLIPKCYDLEKRVIAQLPEGEEINAKTAAVLRFFENHPDLWVNVKPNENAGSCDDAILKRQQLGSIGIPKHKELKTIASIYQLENGRYRIVVAHCPADELINNQALKNVLETEKKLLHFKSKALPFGTFSPFLFDKKFIDDELKNTTFQIERKVKWQDFDLKELLDDERPVIHVFHETMKSNQIFDYMMTNMGHHKLGVQFRPHEVIVAMEEDGLATSAYITPYDQETSCKLIAERKSEYAQHKLGILTGNSSSSGRLLMERFEQEYIKLLGDKFKGDLSMPYISLNSQPKFGYSMEMDANGVEIASILRKETKKLLDDGCTIIALACNTMDVFDDMLELQCLQAGAYYISMNKLVKERLQEIGATDVTILGAEPVASLGRWSAYAEIKDRYVIHETPNIDDVGYAVKGRKSKDEQIKALRDIFNNLSSGKPDTNKKAVVIAALTELSEIFNRFPEAKDELVKHLGDVEIIDTLDLYARALAKTAVELPIAEKLMPLDSDNEYLKTAILFPRALNLES